MRHRTFRSAFGEALLIVGVMAAFWLLIMKASSGSFPWEDPREPVDGLRFVVPILGIVVAFSILQQYRTHRRLRHIEELLDDLRFGEGTRRDRDAVDILIRALRTSDGSVRETALKTLRKLAGMDLGKDPAVWEQWWSGARKTFVRASAASPPEKK